MITQLRASSAEIAAAAFRLRELGIVIALGVAVVFFAIRAPNFLTVSNWQDIAKDVAIVVVVAVGETLVVLTRNIDLSVGSMVGLSAYLSADFLAGHNGAPLVLVALIAIGIGTVLWLVNGLSSRGEDSGDHRPLDTLAIYRGLSFGSRRRPGVRVSACPIVPDLASGRRSASDARVVRGVVALAARQSALDAWPGLLRDRSNPEPRGSRGCTTGRRVTPGFTLCGALLGVRLSGRRAYQSRRSRR